MCSSLLFLDISFWRPGPVIKPIPLPIPLQFVGWVINSVIRFAFFNPPFQLPLIVINFTVLDVTLELPVLVIDPAILDAVLEVLILILDQFFRRGNHREE